MLCFKILSSIVLGYLFCVSEAALKTHYLHDLCYYKDSATIHLKYQQSGILTALSTGEAVACSIQFKPYSGNSVVLSIYRYQLEKDEHLIIEDSDHHKVALLGAGDFSDERKSFVSQGPLTVHFYRNATNPLPRIYFQFTFTHVSALPCSYNEFQCRNRNCVPRSMLCDRHNHCGDNSDQENCVPQNDFNEVTTGPVYKPASSSTILIIILSAVSLLTFSVVLACIIFMCIRKRKPATPTLPSVTATVPPASHSAVPPESTNQPAPSVFSQIRRSLRNLRSSRPEIQKAEEQKTENYEIPPMYPQLPSAPELSGAENAGFQRDE